MFSSLIVASGILLGVAFQAGALTVSSTASQTINGIGASGAWWPKDLYKFPVTVRDQVADLLFGDAQLTSYRYNLGGGGVFVGTPARAPETPYVSTGVYNWTADLQGAYFLQKAAQYKVPIITLFVNSGPPFFTSNGRSCGGTLKDATITQFAQYITDVVVHWKAQGVIFTHISPFNEPNSGFGNGDSQCGQEGMIVTPAQRAPVVNAIRTALNAAGLSSVGIMADESNSLSSFTSDSATWLSNAKASVAAVAHHDYGFATDSAASAAGVTARNLSGGKNPWFTEICCFASTDTTRANDPAAPVGWSGGYDPTIVNGLQLGQLIYRGFTQTLDAHFDWWTALSSEVGCTVTSSTCTTTKNTAGWNDGLIYYDANAATNGNYAIYKTKRFSVLKHFSRGIPIGSRLHLSSDVPSTLRVLALQTAAGPYNLIVMNMATSSSVLTLPTVLGTVSEARTTTASLDWQVLTLSGSNATLPATSITTFFFQ